jgi:hypothetical protein
VQSDLDADRVRAVVEGSSNIVTPRIIITYVRHSRLQLVGHLHLLRRRQSHHTISNESASSNEVLSLP